MTKSYLYKLLKCDNDSDLARALGMSRQRVNAWREPLSEQVQDVVIGKLAARGIRLPRRKRAPMLRAAP